MLGLDLKSLAVGAIIALVAYHVLVKRKAIAG